MGLLRSLFEKRVVAASLVSLFVGCTSVRAEDLTLFADQTKLIMLTRDPGTIVVGNPAIADVTLNGKQLFTHGRSPGNTNLLILDADGNSMLNLDLIVTNGDRNMVTLFTGSQATPSIRTSYTCSPICEPSMTVGDNIDFLQNAIKANGAMAEFATGHKATDSQVPKAPPQ